MDYVNEKDLKTLKKYKYCSIEKSLIQKYILNPFWTWFVSLFPQWFAPNLLTLTGFLFMIASVGLLMVYGSNWETLPSWVYFSWAIFLFLYQTFDGIDGKQARRTGTSGPLGELFDHGCDALNTTLCIIITLYSIGVGPSFLCVYAIIISLMNFYVSTWETYHTHILFLSFFCGPVEGILTACSLYLVTSFTGPAFWNNSVYDLLLKSKATLTANNKNSRLLSHLLSFFTSKDHTLGQIILNKLVNIKLSHVIIVFLSFTAIFNTLYSIINVYHRTQVKNPKNLLKKVKDFLPFLLFSGISMMWSLVSPTMINNNLIPFFFLIGISFGYQASLIVLCHVSGRSFPYWNPTFKVNLISFFSIVAYHLDFVKCLGKMESSLSNVLSTSHLSYYANLIKDNVTVLQNTRESVKSLIQNTLAMSPETLERNFIWFLVGINFILYMRFVLFVIHRLCQSFDINCLSIKNRQMNSQPIIQKSNKISTIKKSVVYNNGNFKTRGRKRMIK